MEISSSSISKYDVEGTALKGLLEAFGSFFSLEDIASAYSKAGRNADLAGEILYCTQESTLSSSSYVSNRNTRVDYSKSTDATISKSSCQANGKSKVAKQKWHPVSGGTVSSVIGKEYIKPVPVPNGSCLADKPLKLDEEVLPMSELWGDGNESKLNTTQRGHYVEDFMFKMLGDSFKLEKNVISQVLDTCGYDMQKSIDRLLDLSAGTSDNSSEVSGTSSEKSADASSDPEGPSWHVELQFASPCKQDSGTAHEELPEKRNYLQNEVLTVLFNGTEATKKSSRRAAKNARRSIALGKLVVEPLMDSTLEEPKSVLISTQKDGDTAEDEENTYELLRLAVKEHLVTMKEYYKAVLGNNLVKTKLFCHTLRDMMNLAVNAFAKGDYDQANRLLDQGHFFHQKAREADEKSSHKIFETKNNAEMQGELVLDLHNHGAREAIRLLRCHLSSLSGIPTFKHLKVIIETNEEEDFTKGARRRLVIKLLEKESITWNEGETSGTILLRLDNVNRRGLSFAKK